MRRDNGLEKERVSADRCRGVAGIRIGFWGSGRFVAGCPEDCSGLETNLSLGIVDTVLINGAVA